MTTSSELISRYLKEKGINQNALAQKWSVTEQYITSVIKGRSKLSDERVIELSESLGLNPAHYLIQIQAEKAKTDKERRTWLKLLQSNAAGLLLAIPMAKHLGDFALCTDMFKEIRIEGV